MLSFYRVLQALTGRRGAAASKGKTSWSSKAEQADYISVLAFLLLYVHNLSFGADAFTISYTKIKSFHHAPLTPIPSSRTAQEVKSVILLAGYSYGAMVASSLPPMLSTMLQPFQQPPLDTPESEIRKRAMFLAAQQSAAMAAHVASLVRSQKSEHGRSLQSEDTHGLRTTSGGMRMGGEEHMRRASHESHRSFMTEAPELVRRSVDRMISGAKHSRGASFDSAQRPRPSSKPESRKLKSPRLSTFDFRRQKSAGMPTSEQETHHAAESAHRVGQNAAEHLEPFDNLLTSIQPAYLLISPLLGPISSLATFFHPSSSGPKSTHPHHEKKFTIDPTLALYGDDDVFVSVKRLRSWADTLSDGGSFCGKEIEGAGHFWHAAAARRELRESVEAFVGDL